MYNFATNHTFCFALGGVVAVILLAITSLPSTPQRPAQTPAATETRAQHEYRKTKRNDRLECIAKVTASLKGVAVEDVTVQRVIRDTCFDH